MFLDLDFLLFFMFLTTFYGTLRVCSLVVLESIKQFLKNRGVVKILLLYKNTSFIISVVNIYK